MPFGLGFFATTGAGAGGSFDFIATATPSSGNQTTFSNIDTYTDYKHLQLRIFARDTIANSANGNITMTFNNDSSAVYPFVDINGSGTSVTVANVSAGNQNMRFHDCLPGGTSTSQAFGALIIDILEFSSTSKQKTVRALIGANTANEQDVTYVATAWESTTAINRLDLFCSNAWASGTRISLYGLRG